MSTLNMHSTWCIYETDYNLDPGIVTNNYLKYQLRQNDE